jgi:hypothetical protein
MNDKQEDNKKSQCNDCYDGEHCEGKIKGCECECIGKQEEWETSFENTFIYKAYGIVEGEGKAMQIRRQDEYQPLTYENVKSFIKSLRSKDRNTLTEKMEKIRKDEKTICPNCNGECQEIAGENLVSMDMAIDAGDISLEGTHHSYEYKVCEICEGTGKIEMPIEFNQGLDSVKQIILEVYK